jgi:Leucine-rich repeat (LRR) protein
MINFLLAFILSISCVVAADSEDIVETTNTRNSHITMLDLSNDESLTDISFVKYFPNLRELNLAGSYNISNLEQIGQFTRLEKLNISSIMIRDDIIYPEIDFISSLVNLRELDISGNQFLFKISPIAILPNLTALNLQCDQEIRDWVSLSSLKSIRRLDLFCAESAVNKINASFLLSLTDLEELTINWEMQIPELPPSIKIIVKE